MSAHPGLRTVEEHRDAALALAGPPRTEELASAAAAGRTLAEPACARVDIPVFDNSAMDGFAVRFADVRTATESAPVTLRIVADLPAGSALDPALAIGEAARIMTGSAVPSDADAIVPFEDTVHGLDASLESTIVVRAPRAVGAHVRRRGEDAHVGDEVLPAGTRLGAFQLGALAAAGIDRVRVSTPPRVAVISTGSELATPGTPLTRGMIPESNSLLLQELAIAAGAEVVLRTSVADDESALRDAVAAAGAVGAQVVVFSGGVSAGAYEVVKNTLGPGGEMDFVKVAMQPGKPQGIGRLADGTVLFGLPGNPVSAAVSFEMFVRPVLLRLQGRTEWARPVLRLSAAEAWRTPPGRRQYLPAVIDRTDPAAWRVRPATAGGSGSHLAGGLGRAEAYAVVPAEVEHVNAGDLVEVLLLD